MPQSREKTKPADDIGSGDNLDQGPEDDCASGHSMENPNSEYGEEGGESRKENLDVVMSVAESVDSGATEKRTEIPMDVSEINRDPETSQLDILCNIKQENQFDPVLPSSQPYSMAAELDSSQINRAMSKTESIYSSEFGTEDLSQRAAAMRDSELQSDCGSLQTLADIALMQGQDSGDSTIVSMPHHHRSCSSSPSSQMEMPEFLSPKNGTKPKVITPQLACGTATTADTLALLDSQASSPRPSEGSSILSDLGFCKSHHLSSQTSTDQDADIKWSFEDVTVTPDQSSQPLMSHTGSAENQTSTLPPKSVGQILPDNCDICSEVSNLESGIPDIKTEPCDMSSSCGEFVKDDISHDIFIKTEQPETYKVLHSDQYTPPEFTSASVPELATDPENVDAKDNIQTIIKSEPASSSGQAEEDMPGLVNFEAGAEKNQEVKQEEKEQEEEPWEEVVRKQKG